MISIARSRLRASRARLVFSISALTVLAVLLSAGPASAAYFTSIVSGSQAGSDQDHAWAFAAAPGETVTGIDLRLTGGYWPHMHKVSARCSAEQAASASGCPAASRVAAANAVFVAGAAPVLAKGYVAIAREREGEIAGADALLVLKPQGRQYSTISNVLKIVIQPEKGDPKLRLALPQVPELRLVSGISANARLSALLINGLDSSSGNKRWIRNPTSCEIKPVQTMLARFADGSVQTVARTQNVTGCENLTMRADVMFNPKEYTIDKARGMRLRLNVDKPAPGELRSDVRGLRARIDTGHVDFDALSALPACADAELERGECPADTRIGKLLIRSGVVEDRFAEAEVWNQPTQSYDTNPVKEAKIGVTLRNRTVGSGGGGSGEPIWIGHGRVFAENGGVVIVLDGLPQIDTNGFELELESALFEDDNNCQTATLAGVVTGWSGARRDIRSTVGWRCAPKLVLTDPRDADADGNLYADAPYRPVPYAVWYAVSPGPAGTAPPQVTCKVRGWDPKEKQPIAKLTDVDGDGTADACVVSEASGGELELELSATYGPGWPVRVVTRKYIVDVSPPQVELDHSTTRTTPSTSFGTMVRISDDNGIASVRCGVATGAGAAAGAATRCADGTCSAVENNGSTPGSGLYKCTAESDEEGMAQYEIVVTDVAGNKSTAPFDVFFDRTAPNDTTVDPLDSDDDGDGFAERRYRPASFEITYADIDDSFGYPLLRREARRKCRAERRGVTDVAPGEITELAAGTWRCSFTGLADGDWDVTFESTDAAGNVGTHTTGVTVDTRPPAITDLSPAEGEWIGCRYNNDPYAEDAIRVKFRLADSSSDPATVSVTFNNGPSQTVPVKAGTELQTLDLNIDCREMTTGMDAEYRIAATDAAGNSSDESVSVRVDVDPPAIVTADYRDGDKDQDGKADDYLRSSSFEVPFEATDAGSGLAEKPSSCMARVRSGIEATGSVIAQGAARYVCSLQGLPDGDATVVITAADAVGHEQVLERGFGVDGTAPVVTITGYPFDPDVREKFNGLPAVFDVDDENPGTSRCEVFANAGQTTETMFDFTCEGYVGPTGDACDPAIASPAECRRAFVLPHVLDSSGRYLARVTHTDRAGNSASAELPFEIDVDAPGITLGATGVQFTRESFFDMPVEIDDAHPARIFCRAAGGGATGSGQCQDGGCAAVGDLDGEGLQEFRCRAEGFAEGSNKFEIVAVDTYGNSSSAFFDVFFDSTAPVIDFAQPSPAHTTNTTHDVAFSVADASVTADGAPRFVTECEVKKTEPEIDAPCDSVVSYRPANAGAESGLDGVNSITGLSVGEYRLSLKVTDPAGNSSTAFFDVFVDPPSATVRFVGAPSIVNTARPTFRLGIENGDPQGATDCYAIPEVDDEVLVMFSCAGSWNGGDCDCAATAMQDLAEGKYHIHAIHHGRYGNTEATHAFTVDLTPPAVTFTTFDGAPIDPVSPPQTTNPTPEAEFTTNEPAQTDCAVDTDPSGGTPASELDFAPCTLKIKVGPNAADPSTTKSWCFRVRATDDAGNTSDSKLCFTIVPPAPTVTIQSPANGQVFPITGVVHVNFAIAGGALPLHTWCYFDGRSTMGMFFDPCESGLSKEASSLGGGAHNATIVTLDALGRQASRVVNFIVGASTQPPDACIAVYPLPPGCPGYPGTPVIP